MVNTQESRPPLRWASVCIDCADAEQMAEFYARLLGWEITDRDTPATRQGGSGWVALRDPAGGVGLSFQAEEWYQPPYAHIRQLSSLKRNDCEVVDSYAMISVVRYSSHLPT